MRKSFDVRNLAVWCAFFDGRVWTDSHSVPRIFASEATAREQAQECARFAATMITPRHTAKVTVRPYTLSPRSGEGGKGE
jgi:hypothetical protein